MSSNSSTVERRPRVVRVIWNNWSEGTGGPPSCPGRYLDILIFHRVEDLHGGQSIRLHPVRVEPNAHAISAGPDNGDLADAGQAGERLLEIDDGVVAEEFRIVAVVVRSKADEHQDVGRYLLDADALALHLRGELRDSAVDGVLHERQGSVQIGANIE